MQRRIYLSNVVTAGGKYGSPVSDIDALDISIQSLNIKEGVPKGAPSLLCYSVSCSRGGSTRPSLIMSATTSWATSMNFRSAGDRDSSDTMARPTSRR